MARLYPFHDRPTAGVFRCLKIAGACALAMAFGLSFMDKASAQMGAKVRRQEEKAPTRSGPVEQQFPFGATWILTDLGGKTIGGDAPSFDLDDKLRAVGFGGCNTFSMSLYPIKEQKLAAGSVAMTRKSCGKEIDDTEHAMLVTLHSLPRWHLESNGDLLVTGVSGVLRFKRGL